MSREDMARTWLAFSAGFIPRVRQTREGLGWVQKLQVCRTGLRNVARSRVLLFRAPLRPL